LSTIKDIAAHTGLSVATVSKYLNGGNVLPENHKVLEKAVKKLNYRMNHLARGLKTRKSFTVGLLIPRLNNVFYSSLASHIESGLSEAGYSTIICTYHDDPETEAARLDFLLSKGVDGLLFVPLGRSSKSRNILSDTDVPVVMVDRALDGFDCDVVLSDNHGAAYNTTKYLAENGHKRIGIILGPEGVYTADERHRGYLQAVDDFKLDSSPELIRRGEYDIESGKYCTEAFLALPSPPTALFITNYEMTIGGIIALETGKMKIPENISMIGFDNLELARTINPPLTVVVQRLDKLADEAVRILLARLNNTSTGDVTVSRFNTELVVRESVKRL